MKQQDVSQKGGDAAPQGQPRGLKACRMRYLELAVTHHGPQHGGPFGILPLPASPPSP